MTDPASGALRQSAQQALLGGACTRTVADIVNTKTISIVYKASIDPRRGRFALLPGVSSIIRNGCGRYPINIHID
jgi:hypothetical protein